MKNFREKEWRKSSRLENSIIITQNLKNNLKRQVNAKSKSKSITKRILTS
ncbi:Uncharacterised protein [Helicobacter fennelliae]|nr:Uncharacterised protein [Helicobacter fennelliae]